MLPPALYLAAILLAIFSTSAQYVNFGFKASYLEASWGHARSSGSEKLHCSRQTSSHISDMPDFHSRTPFLLSNPFPFSASYLKIAMLTPEFA